MNSTKPTQPWKVSLPEKYIPSIKPKPLYNLKRKIRGPPRGLVARKGTNKCVVKEMEINVQINDLACKMEIRQKYTNKNENPIEAT